MSLLADSLGTGPWTLVIVFALVLLDAVVVVIPGEIAVSAAGALSTSTGSPPLAALIAVAATAAVLGDMLCYWLGRVLRPAQWHALRGPRAQRAFAWAGARLDRGMVSVVFTARFIPFARLAVNLTAGATRVPAGRYLAVVVVAGTAWALYQSVIGAALGVVFAGAPILAMVTAVIAAVTIGVVVDVVLNRRRLRAGEDD